jgi:hypothetical protein
MFRGGHARLFRAHGKALPPFGATPLENQPAVLGAHPNEKPVSFAPVAGIRLKRALALHVCSPEDLYRLQA